MIDDLLYLCDDDGVFESFIDIVIVVDPVLVLELVCDDVTVFVPLDDTDDVVDALGLLVCVTDLD
jgi:hypothetical protein